MQHHSPPAARRTSLRRLILYAVFVWIAILAALVAYEAIAGRYGWPMPSNVASWVLRIVAVLVLIQALRTHHRHAR